MKHTPKKGKYGYSIEIAATIRHTLNIEKSDLDANGQISDDKIAKLTLDYFDSLDGSPDAGSCLMGISNKDIKVDL